VLDGIEKTFGAGAALAAPLHGLTATITSGRLTVVTGPSGSGKTTFLRLVAGLALPTGGDIEVLGTRLSGLDRAAHAALRRRRVAVVEQDAALVEFLSARETVELALALRDVPARHRSRRALDALAAVGLGELAEQRVSRLSSGERQRVAIARALAARPELLLADEPTARLDEANARAVGELFARLVRETGVTILCATHDPALVEQADDELALG
jgi:putative ABC transport system ATP-binding protein